MPTSATGTRNSAARAGARGFTLLELMVVVAIIGVMLVVVRISLPDRDADALRLEARRFVDALQDCREGAVLSGAPIGIRLGGASYALERYRGHWQPLRTPRGEADVRRLPEGLEVALLRARGDATRPAVVCLPSGETRIGEVALGARGARAYYRFRDDQDGAFVADWVAPPT